MQCEGSAFQRVARLDPKKLRVGNLEGVKAIVEALGGIWGKSRLEDKFERFERAIYSTVQRADETHESYLARHDHQFEELLSMKVGMDEFRAYILLRNSALSSEDKKRLIVESQGSLEYREVVSTLKLLGVDSSMRSTPAESRTIQGPKPMRPMRSLPKKLMVTTKHPTSPPTISMIGPRKNGLRVLQMMVTRTPP